MSDISSVPLRYLSNVPMAKDISMKELRAHLADVADRVEHGESFRVIRRSRPSFIIMNINAEVPEEGWETVVDFTNGGKKVGMPVMDVVKIIKKIRR